MRWLLMLAALGAPAAALSAPPADPKARIEKAKAAYDGELDKLETTVANLFNTYENAARKQGDKATLDRLKPERVAFDLTGALPKDLPAATKQKFTAASDALAAAYNLAIKEYTKAGKDDEAAAVQKELDKLKKGPGERYFYLVNKKTGLVVATETETGARGSHLVQVKRTDKPHQQWAFVPTNRQHIYHVKNRASGHFFNIGGGVGEGARLTVWDGGGGTNNNFTPTREGFYYTFLSDDSKKFACVADTTDAEGKPVIQREKPAGDIHLWALVPVK